jgi:hypothetical protein
VYLFIGVTKLVCMEGNIENKYIATGHLKTGRVDREEMATFRQWLDKHTTAAGDTHSTIEQLWRWSVLRTMN